MQFREILVLVGACALVGAACDSDTNAPNGGPLGDAAVGDAGEADSNRGDGDAMANPSPDAGSVFDGSTGAPASDAAACSDPGSLCHGVCVDTSSDELHCGACDVACAERQGCEQGECRDQWGLTTRVPVTTCAIPAQPPSLVSNTGCYANVASRAPAQGLIQYVVASSLWADGTHKRRFLALPGNATIGFTSDGAWQLPVGTVLIKEFLLETKRGDPASLRPLETRFMVRRANGWDGYTYRWRDDLSEADLYNGGEVSYAITEADGKSATYTHVFPGKNDCQRCHNDTAGGTLGMRTVQMNREFDYGAVSDNQLRAFGHIGLFGATLPTDLSTLPSMPDPLDTGAPLAARARSYLQGNCAHCHHPGGPTGKAIDLRYLTPFSATQTCDTKPQAGDLGVQNAQIITPGRHDLSVLWLRMSRRGGQQMPPLGTLLVDGAGSALVRDWIDGLKSCQ